MISSEAPVGEWGTASFSWFRDELSDSCENVVTCDLTNTYALTTQGRLACDTDFYFPQDAAPSNSGSLVIDQIVYSVVYDGAQYFCLTGLCELDDAQHFKDGNVEIVQMTDAVDTYDPTGNPIDFRYTLKVKTTDHNMDGGEDTTNHLVKIKAVMTLTSGT